MTDNHAPKPIATWEDFLHCARESALICVHKMGQIDDAELAWLRLGKLVYSAGTSVFGCTHHRTWRRPDGTTVPVVSIEALVQEEPAQLCETLLHELGHVLAAHRASGTLQGHNKAWQTACHSLGHTSPSTYAKPASWSSSFSPEVAKVLRAIPTPDTDGHTANPYRFSTSPDAAPGTVETPFGTTRRLRCTDGIGSLGGKSSGTGSGSRYLLFVCGTCSAKARLTGSASRRIICAGTDDAPHDPIRMELDPSSLPATRTNPADAADVIAQLVRALGGDVPNKGRGKKAIPDLSKLMLPPLEWEQEYTAFVWATLMPEPPSFDALDARLTALLTPVGKVTWPPIPRNRSLVPA